MRSSMSQFQLKYEHLDFLGAVYDELKEKGCSDGRAAFMESLRRYGAQYFVVFKKV